MLLLWVNLPKTDIFLFWVSLPKQIPLFAVIFLPLDIIVHAIILALWKAEARALQVQVPSGQPIYLLHKKC